MQSVEETLEMDVALPDLVQDILGHVQQESSARQSIDYYCLGMAADVHCDELPDEYGRLLDYIQLLSRELVRTLQVYRAYHAGYMPYKLMAFRRNSLYLQREDLYHDEQQRAVELYNPYELTRLPTRPDDDQPEPSRLIFQGISPQFQAGYRR